MQASNAPSKVQIPFADSGPKNTIPVASQVGVTPGAASFTTGFPPLTMTPLVAGGVPPYGQDMNGILNAITAIQQWQSAGGSFKYDAAWSSANAGYPQGAYLVRADNTGFWFNTVDGNTTNPDTGGAGWVPGYNYGISAVAGLTNANVTLTPAQYSNPVVTLAGTLTGNVQIIFPATLQQWVIVNNTAGGNFSVTCKTAAGTGVVVARGTSQAVYGDGANINAVGVIPGQLSGGQCRLSVASVTSLVLSPYNGNTIIINGAPRQIPSGGVTVTNSGVTANSLRYVYAYMSGSTMTLEVVTTGHSTGTDGVEIKTGDPSRSLVGMIYSNASSQFVDTPSSRQCLSWFNRRSINGSATNSSNASTASSTPAPIAGYQVDFLSWADESVFASVSGTATTSGANQTITSFINIDVTTNGGPAFSLLSPSTGLIQGGFALNFCKDVTEGRHSAYLLGRITSGGTGTWLADQCQLVLEIRG